MVRRLPRKRPRGEVASLGRTLASTAAVSSATSFAAALSGVLLARELGPDARGQYAAVIAWFGLSLIIGELGQAAATTYFVARDPSRAQQIVATARLLMTVIGSTLALVGILLAPVLAHGVPDLAFAYRTMFVAAIPSFLGASYWFALQATNISTWNLVRISQPVAYLVLVIIGAVTTTLTLKSVCLLLATTAVAQSTLAFVLARRQSLGGGRTDRALVKPLLVYGSSQMASTAPQTLNARLDQLVMSQTLRPSDLGHYAVAVTYSSLAVPLVSALGSVLFPRLARMRRDSAERKLVGRAIWGSLLASMVCVGGLTAAANWVIPWLFGEEYRSSVNLAWVLAPCGVFLASAQVLGDLLRGRGQPLAAARAQAAGLVVTVVGLAVFLPLYGSMGAAITASAAGAAIWALLLTSLVRSHGINEEQREEELV